MIFFKSRCYNGGSRHQFESRFDRTFPTDWEEIHGNGARTLEAAKEFRYVCDVCTWCGKMVKRIS